MCVCTRKGVINCDAPAVYILWDQLARDLRPTAYGSIGLHDEIFCLPAGAEGNSKHVLVRLNHETNQKKKKPRKLSRRQGCSHNTRAAHLPRVRVLRGVGPISFLRHSFFSFFFFLSKLNFVHPLYPRSSHAVPGKFVFHSFFSPRYLPISLFLFPLVGLAQLRRPPPITTCHCQRPGRFLIASQTLTSAH